MSLKGTGFAKRDDDWRCPAPCLHWHRKKTNYCIYCKSAPPRYRVYRKALRELHGQHKLLLDKWVRPKTDSNL